MNQKGFHGTSFLDIVCGRKQPKGKAGGVCGFVHVRRGNHLQCPETGVNHSKLQKQKEWVNESTIKMFSSYSIEDVQHKEILFHWNEEVSPLCQFTELTPGREEPSWLSSPDLLQTRV